MTLELDSRELHELNSGSSDDEKETQIDDSQQEIPDNLPLGDFVGWRLDKWKKDLPYFLRALFAEFLATTAFIFMVLAPGIHFDRSQALHGTTYITNPTVGGVSTALAGVVLVYTFAEASGAHFNPAVTFATVVTFKMTVTKGLCYMMAQCLGSTFACLLLALIFPGHFENIDAKVVTPSADVQIYQAFFAEMILTCILVFVIFAVAFDTIESAPQIKANKTVGSKVTIYSITGESKAGFAPIAIGFTLGALVFSSGTISGGAFNPARAFGPALVVWEWENQWLYWIADFCGAGLAGWLQAIFAKPKKNLPQFENPKVLFVWLWERKGVSTAEELKKFLLSWLV